MKNLSTLSKIKFAVVSVLVGWMGITQANAQQEAQYSQYMFNMLAVNPAYAGSRDVLSLTGLFRQQWVNIDGAPQTISFSADMPLRQETIGIGLKAYKDKLGITDQTNIDLAASYRVRLTTRTTLAVGLQAGVLNYQARLSSVNTGQTPGYDPAFSNDINKLVPNFGAGIYLSNDRYYLGFSVPQFLESRLSNYVIAGNDSLNGARNVLKRHFFGMFGFVVPLGSSLKLKPSFLVKYVPGAPLALDANLNLWIKDKIAIGGSWRTSRLKFNEKVYGNTYNLAQGDAVVGMIEFQMSDQFRLGYAYDFTINGLNTGGIAGATHEVMLRYEFGFSKSKILTPRYF